MPDILSSSASPMESKEKNNSLVNSHENPQSRKTCTCAHAATSNSITSNSSGTTANLHILLLLSDSALPLGSFAFSSGLESYYAHQKCRQQQQRQQQRQSNPAAFTQPVLSPVAHLTNFLNLSLLSTAAFALPYIFAAHAFPKKLLEIDDFCDASTTCAVARRASVAQGRALLTVWERSFSSVLVCFADDDGGYDDGGAAKLAKVSISDCSYHRESGCCHLEEKTGDRNDQAGDSSSILYGEQDSNAHDPTQEPENVHTRRHAYNSYENLNADTTANLSIQTPKTNTHTTTPKTKSAKPAPSKVSKTKQAAYALSTLQSLMRNSGSNKNKDPAATATYPDDVPPVPSAHYAPLWGAVTRAANLPDAHSAAYVFLFGHACAVISAGVRSGMLGPYQAQALLAGAELRKEIEGLVADAQADADAAWQVKVDGGVDDDEDERWLVGIERSAQAVPAMDLWIGRHELLYSRIFNS